MWVLLQHLAERLVERPAVRQEGAGQRAVAHQVSTLDVELRRVRAPPHALVGLRSMKQGDVIDTITRIP